MIRFGKWVQTASKQPLAAVRVTHYLTREEMESLLIKKMEPHSLEEMKDLTAKQTETAIREQLESSFESAMYWQDRYRDYEDYDDVSQDQVSEWAKRQVARMLGEN